MHLALYRKYRSQTFGDLVGQEHVVRTLQNSITSGRLAHAYLFTGPRGTGKTSSARLLAKAINCEVNSNGEPCNECDACRSITAGNNLDVIEIDAASESGVEQVREKIVNVAEYRPATARYKVFIIDEVHDLSNKAFDALLKTIEEPPGHVVFVLATTEYTKVPSTIRSRCQKYEFHRASLADLVKRLEYVVHGEGAEADPAALSAIARMADGGFRDALSLLEQALLVGGGKLTLEGVYEQLGLIQDEAVDGLLGSMRDQNVPDVIARLDSIYRQGRDPRSVVESMVYRISDLTRAIYGVETGGSDATGEAALHATGARLGAEFLTRVRRAAADLQKGVRDVTLPRLWLEAELISLSFPPAAIGTPPVTPSASPAQTSAIKAEKPVARTVSETVEPQAVVNAPAPVQIPREHAVPADPETLTPPAPTGNEDFDLATNAWFELMNDIRAKSPAARTHLRDCQVVAVDSGTVKIGFGSAMSADWVPGNAKVRAYINQKWPTLIDGRKWQLEYVHAPQLGKANSIPDAVVERPLEGERLKQVGTERFADL